MRLRSHSVRPSLQRALQRTVLLAATLSLISLTACAPITNTLQTTNAFTPHPDATILLMPADVQLGLLTMGGLFEPRADWTAAAEASVYREIESKLSQSGHRVTRFDESTPPTDEELQIIRLHEAVGQTISTFKQGIITLPSKRGVFDWSLGSSVKALADKYEADYALFVHARGRYASGARMATAVAVAIIAGVPMETGRQEVFASLVDLRTGDVLWFNVAQSVDSHDIRKPKGADTMFSALLKDIPV